jgi:hypothetical protein
MASTNPIYSNHKSLNKTYSMWLSAFAKWLVIPKLEQNYSAFLVKVSYCSIDAIAHYSYNWAQNHICLVKNEISDLKNEDFNVKKKELNNDNTKIKFYSLDLLLQLFYLEFIYNKNSLTKESL